jgi:hypothetical protein
VCRVDRAHTNAAPLGGRSEELGPLWRNANGTSAHRWGLPAAWWLGKSASMGVSDWFKRKRAPEAKGPPAIPRPDEFITVYDERGRELKVKRADWVSNVLMPAIENAWNDPKELSSQIVQALQDDLVEQVAEAAERLVELDRESENALVLVAVVRMEKGDLKRAISTERRGRSSDRSRSMGPQVSCSRIWQRCWSVGETFRPRAQR